MSAALGGQDETAPSKGRSSAPLLPAGFDWVVFGALVAGLLLLYGPAYGELARTIWATDEQGHGPIILAVSIWLLWTKRHEIAALPARPAAGAGWSLLAFALLLFTFGRSQHIIMFEIGSQILLLVALLLVFRGWAALHAAWFALFFMLFMVPWPEAVVAAVTGPLKAAVSAVASDLLYRAGYPVGRTGVMLTVGPYELMVADACAGLNSMFTLEALGMLYMNLMHYTNTTRNALLALLLVPTAFAANIVRVLILVLVTYYFGDAAGQSFVHGFAGIVLFVVALMLMLVLDRLLGVFLSAYRKEAAG